MKMRYVGVFSLVWLLAACELSPNPAPAVSPTSPASTAPIVAPTAVPVVTVQPPAPQPMPQPTAAPSAPPPQSQAAQTHTVRPRDNLYRIGLRYGVPWRSIAEANGIVNPRLLPIGKVLTIPPPLR